MQVAQDIDFLCTRSNEIIIFYKLTILMEGQQYKIFFNYSNFFKSPEPAVGVRG